MNLLNIQICEDDEEIKTLLVQHGKQTHLIPRITPDRPFRTHVVWADDTTCYAVTQFHCQLMPWDNGYCAIKIPLTDGTPEEISRVVNAWIQSGMDEGGHAYSLVERDAAEVN